MGAPPNTEGKKPVVMLVSIGLLLSVFLISIATISHLGLKMSEQHAPLVDASMEIKYNASLFHLWFEEMIQGDPSVDEKKVWAYLDASEWYAKAMIEGGENEEGSFKPLDNPRLRGQILEVFASIRDMREKSRRRLEHAATSGIGSQREQAFDKAFVTLLQEADDVETVLQTSIADDLRWYRIISVGLFAVCIVIACAVFFGITFYERRRSSDHTRLERSEKHLDTTLDSIGDAVMTTDTKGFVTRMNPVAEALTGWDAGEALGKPLDEVFEIYHGKTNEKVESPVDRVLREGAVAGLGNHTVLVSRTGEKHHISDSASPIHGIANKLSGVVMVFRDDTEKYAFTEALKDSEERFRETVSNAADAIITIDGQGSIESFNYSAEEIFGYAAKEVIGHNVNMLMPEPYHSEHNDYLSRYRNTGEARIIGKRSWEVMGRRKDGNNFSMELSVNEMMHGNEKKFIGFVRDITERQRVEKERAQLFGKVSSLSRKLLELQEEERKHIARTLHDDIGQSLTVIKSYSASIIGHCEKRHLRQAITAAKEVKDISVHLLQTVRDQLRDLSPGYVNELGLKGAVQNLCDVWERSNAFACRTKISDKVDDLPGDLQVQVFRIVQEALTNVAKHAEASTAKITLRLSKGGLDVDITDDGRGFDTAASTRGMGLVGIRERALAIEGQLQLQSSPEKGTQIHVHLPPAAQPASEP